jgi:hypothetical protein
MIQVGKVILIPGCQGPIACEVRSQACWESSSGYLFTKCEAPASSGCSTEYVNAACVEMRETRHAYIAHLGSSQRTIFWGYSALEW